MALNSLLCADVPLSNYSLTRLCTRMCTTTFGCHSHPPLQTPPCRICRLVILTNMSEHARQSTMQTNPWLITLCPTAHAIKAVIKTLTSSLCL